MSRHGYLLSIYSWFFAGFLAFLVHFVLYTDFPMGSHIKLLIGYWILGGGILAQWEYVDIEKACRQSGIQSEGVHLHSERLTRRLTESFAIFTVVPALAMLLIIMRTVYEGQQKIHIRPVMLYEALFLGCFFVLVSLVVAWRYGKTLKRDTDQIVSGLAKVEEGSFNVALDTSRADEFGRVAEGINNMIRGLVQRERIREAFGHFVAPEVAKDFLERYISDKNKLLGGEKKQLTVLFSDIRNFTPLAESMEPEALTEFLNSYFSEMVIAVRSNGGVIDKFMGDAIMAIFGLIPNTQRSQQAQAIDAALEMIQRLESFNQTRKQTNPDAPKITAGIGIHSGEVVAGYIGSEDRLEFTVVGQNVNIAARIEGQCTHPAPSLLFSETLAQQIENDFAIQKVLTTELKGVSDLVTLFTIATEHET